MKRSNSALTAELCETHAIEDGWQYGKLFHTRWSDIDGFSHVNHRAHLVWYEEVRNFYLADAGYPLVDATIPGPVLREISCGYEKPLGHGELVVVTGRTAWVGRTSFRMDYAVWRHGLVSRSHAVCVWFRNRPGESVPLPEELRRYMFADGALERDAFANSQTPTPVGRPL